MKFTDKDKEMLIPSLKGTEEMNYQARLGKLDDELAQVLTERADNPNWSFEGEMAKLQPWIDLGKLIKEAAARERRNGQKYVSNLAKTTKTNNKGN